MSADRFEPARWLAGPHRQTLWPVLKREKRAPARRRERVRLPDGDFVDVDWSGPAAGPVVLVLHGLAGSSSSGYVLRLQRALVLRGVRGAALNFRGCSGEPNERARAYHSGDTGDLAAVVAHIRRREPGVPLALAGFSLGGNVALKWLGQARPAGLSAAAVVSAPFELRLCADRLDRGLARFYRDYLIGKLRRQLAQKRAHLLGHGSEAEAERLRALAPLPRLPSFREFDERVTAPLHGFAGAADYYRRASCRRFVCRIETPTLVVQALDDPLVPRATLPAPSELPPNVTLALSPRGGHVGFIADGPLGADWLAERVAGFLVRRLW